MANVYAKNTIIISGEHGGRVRFGGTISGTPKPGTLMQIVAATEPVGDRFTWQAFTPSGGDGKPGLIAVLLEDNKQGKLTTDAYVSGTYGEIYIPVPGDILNVLVGEVAGTGNTFAIGDYFMADAEDGILVPNSSGVSVPFQCLETRTQIAGSTLVACVCTGH